MYAITARLVTTGAAALMCASTRYFRPFILPPLLAGSVVTSIFIAEKLGDLYLPIIGVIAVSGSILIYSSTFLVTDVMSKLHGKKFAPQRLWAQP